MIKKKKRSLILNFFINLSITSIYTKVYFYNRVIIVVSLSALHSKKMLTLLVKLY